MGYEKELRVLRDKIDSIDARLVPLFEARMQVSDEIADVKQRYGRPVFDADRENNVMERALSHLTDSSSDAEARRFFRALMDLSKQRQGTHFEKLDDIAADETPAIRHLGLKGSFSHIAALEALAPTRRSKALTHSRQCLKPCALVRSGVPYCLPKIRKRGASQRSLICSHDMATLS